MFKYWITELDRPSYTRAELVNYRAAVQMFGKEAVDAAEAKVRDLGIALFTRGLNTKYRLEVELAS